MGGKKVHVKPDDIKLILGSIRKWENAVKFYETDGQDGKHPSGVSDCPLCQKYHPLVRYKTDICGECPIHKDTGRSYCYGTPCTRSYNTPVEWAQAELVYLHDLLYRCVIDKP